MFMEKIDLPRVTCDLFGVKSGFYGSGNGGSITGDKPRAATEDEARAYADFIRRKNGLPDIGKPHMRLSGGYRGRTCAFHYVGATFGQHLGGGEYEAGAYSVLFPGANMMRATVTMETLDEAGDVVSSQTMPIEPKKGGVVWSRDDVRKACGPVAKVKAARKAPTVAKRRAAPTVDKRRRAIMLALKLRAELRRMRAEARQAPEDCVEPAPAPDAPATAPDAILSDLAAAEALMRGEGYAPPADDALREGLRIILHRGSYEGLRATVYSNGAGHGWGAVTDCGRHVSIASYGTPDRGWSLCPTVDEAAPAPTAIHRKRTPAHERAIRRAWAERKARRYAVQGAAAFRQMLEVTEAAHKRAEHLETVRCDQVASLVNEVQRWQDRATLAEQEAAEALASREDLKRMLADAEARLAAAEAENAQLWAEIEALTAPAPALAA